MLDGSVVAHAAGFRVFHGNPGANSSHRVRIDQFSMALTSGKPESMPTDLHLREFTQLEAQLKVLPATNGGSPALANAQTGAMVECISFYTRLMTPESFVWPDFLATVFTKLAEHFASSDNLMVKQAVLEVFQRSTAHVAQLIAHVLTPLSKTSDAAVRTLSLQLLGTMPGLIKADISVQTELISRLSSKDQGELSAAIAASRAVLPLSPSFQKRVLPQLMESDRATLAPLLEPAVANATEAKQAWEHCARLYRGEVDDQAAVYCIGAMGSIAASYPQGLIGVHIQLLHHIIHQDPRKCVQNFALRSSQRLITEDSEEEHVELIVQSLVMVLQAKTFARLKLSALNVLEKIAVVQHLGEFEAQVIADTERFSMMKDDRFGITYAGLLNNIVKRELKAVTDSVSATQIPCLYKLLTLLHPNWFAKKPNVWMTSLQYTGKLSKLYPKILASTVIASLLDLIPLAQSKSMKQPLIKLLSLVALFSGEQLREATPILVKQMEMLTNEDTSIRLGLGKILLCAWKVVVAQSNDNTQVDSLKKTFADGPYLSHADRYEMAKHALMFGHLRLALALLTPVAVSMDHECFSGWLLALRAWTEGELIVQSSACVSMSSLHHLSRTLTYIKAATTTKYGFEFQKAFLELRSSWMQQLLQAQQFSGEIAYTNAKGSAREESLRDRLRQLAGSFYSLRSQLLGVESSDLNILAGHARLCLVVAMGVEGFLLLGSPRNVRSPHSASSVYEQVSTVKYPSTLDEACSALEGEILRKTEQLQRSNSTQLASLGGKVMQQMLASICSLPCSIPRQFFRMEIKPMMLVRSTAQFLTFAECTAFTSKPRPRSQLGVSLGTDFTCALKGAIRVHQDARNNWRDTFESIEVEISVASSTQQRPGSAKSSYERSTLATSSHDIRALLPVTWSAEENPRDVAVSAWCYVPFESSVLVPATQLTSKGSYVVLATISVKDVNGEQWPLAATGCSRGFIVY